MKQGHIAPCPFQPCIGEGEPVKSADGFIPTQDVYVVQCSQCGCQGPAGFGADGAIENWNKRAKRAR